MMRTKAEIIARIESLKATRQIALEERLVWTTNGINEEIKALEWVMGQ